MIQGYNLYILVENCMGYKPIPLLPTFSGEGLLLLLPKVCCGECVILCARGLCASHMEGYCVCGIGSIVGGNKLL